MIELLASAAGGGLFGLLGTGLKRLFGYVEQRQANAHELALLDAEHRNVMLELQGRERVAQIEGESAEQVARSNALSAAITAESQLDAPGWVDAVRGLTRPVLTLLLVILVAIIWLCTDDPSLEARVVDEVVFMASAAVLFWFGDRPSKGRV